MRHQHEPQNNSTGRCCCLSPQQQRRRRCRRCRRRTALAYPTTTLGWILSLFVGLHLTTVTNSFPSPQSTTTRSRLLSCLLFPRCCRWDNGGLPQQLQQQQQLQHRNKIHVSLQAFVNENDENSSAESTTTHDDDDQNEQELFRKKLQDRKFVERNKHWIVIVDDEQAIRQAVGDFLYDSGYQVTACADAEALWQVVTTMTTTTTPESSSPTTPGAGQSSSSSSSSSLPMAIPAAIVSDVRMPGINGMELLGWIRADERLSRVPVILLTAKAMTQDRIEGYKAGADVYLPKPFHPDELLSILDNAIARRRQMMGEPGNLAEMKQEMADIKWIMKQNGAKLVKKTNVFLTLAEREVLELLSYGYTNAEIANERGVSVASVNRTMQKLYTVTRTKTRTELVRWAIQTGYVARR